MYIALFTSSVLLDSLGSEQSKPFLQAVPETYGAAETAAGFIWRTRPAEYVLDESGKPKRIAYTATPSFYDDPDNVVQTLSVWADIPFAWAYVYRGKHLDALRQRGEWMHKPVHAQYVLWWLPKDSTPTHIEGVKRLEQLDKDGSKPNSFTFRAAFSASGESVDVARV